MPGRLNLALRALTGRLETDLQAALVQIVGSITQRAPKRGIKEILEGYSTMPWLRAASSRVADSIAAVQWELYAVKRNGKAVRERGFQKASSEDRAALKARFEKAGELQEIAEHPLLDLLDAGMPPILDGRSARKVTQLHLDLAGEAFWLVTRDGIGKPSRFFPLSPAWIADTPKPTRPTFIVRTPYAAPEQEFPDATDPASKAQQGVIWLKDPDPADPLGRGSGVGRALGTELDTDEFAAEYVKNFFLNDAKPPLVIFGKNMRADDVPRFEAKWLEKTQGTRKAHMPFFMGGSEVEVKELLQSFQSMQFVELRQHERDTILQTFGVPPEILGIVTNSNRATAQEAFRIFSQVVLAPRLEAMRSALQEALVPMFDDRLVLEFVSPVPDDWDFRLEAMKAAPHAFDVDEWREMAERDPYEDDFGKTHYGPLNLVPVGQDTVRPAAAAPTGQRALPETKAPLLTGGHMGNTADEEYSTIHRAANRMVPDFIRAFRGAVEAVSLAIDLAKVEDAFRANSQVGVETALGLEQFHVELTERIRGQIMRTLALAGEGMVPELPQQIREAITTRTKDDGDDAAGGFVFDATNPRATAFAAERGALLVTLVDEETRAAIRQVIANSFENQITPRDAAKLLRDLIGVDARQAMSLAKIRQALVNQGIEGEALERRLERATEAMIRKRAMRIARTETLMAANFGARELWQQAAEAGLFNRATAEKEFVATHDDRTHVGCLMLDGVRVGLDQSFASEYGPISGPPLHPNCRCTVALVPGENN